MYNLTTFFLIVKNKTKFFKYFNRKNESFSSGKYFTTGFVVQSLSHNWLCNPMDSSTPGSSVLHCLPEFAQIHVHWVDDAVPL